MRFYELRIFKNGNGTTLPDWSDRIGADDDTAALEAMREYAATQLLPNEQVWLYPQDGDRSIGSEQGSAVSR